MTNNLPLQIGFFGYLIAALAFVSLATLTRPGAWSLSAPGLRVWLASALSVVWSVFCMKHAFSDAITDAGLYFADIALSCAWLWALVSIGRLQSLPSTWLRVVTAGSVACLGAGAFLLWSSLDSAEAVAAAYNMTPVGLLLALLGVLSIEQVFRNATPETHFAIRWVSVGVGGMFVVNLFMFAEAMLTHELNIEIWAIRSFLFAAMALPLIVGIRRLDQQWANKLFISRHVVFYTTSFVLVGGYLVLMSIGGWYLRSSGGAWGRPAEVFFLTAAALLLAVMIFSGTARRKLMVWLTKSFYRNRYDYRAEWLRFIRTLSAQSESQSIQETAIVSVAQILGSDRGALWVYEGAGKRFLPAASWPNSGAVMDLPTLGSGDALASFIVRTGWVVDLRELVVRPGLYDDLRIDDRIRDFDGEAIFLPLLHRDQMYGLMGLARPQGLDQLNFEDRDLLKTVGRHLAAHLSQDDNDRLLAESSQFEAYNRLTAFVMHDLKNLTAQLQLVVHNAERHKRNPEFVDDAIATIANSVDRMGRLLEQLTRGSSAEYRRRVDLAETIRKVAERVSNRLPVCHCEIASALSVEADPERLAMVLDHVVRNAQDASDEKGEVRVVLDEIDGCPRIRVMDNGSGMEDAFIRERLFRPFDTTKGAKGMGIGAYQAREYLRSLGGDVLVSSAPGKGTCFTLKFPGPSAAAASSKT